MIILFSIIAFHLLVILAGRNLRKFDLRGIAVLVILTLLLVGAVMYGMFTMRNPEVTH